MSPRPWTLDLPRFRLLNKLIYTCKEQHYGAIFDRAMTENIFSWLGYAELWRTVKIGAYNTVTSIIIFSQQHSKNGFFFLMNCILFHLLTYTVHVYKTWQNCNVLIINYSYSDYYLWKHRHFWKDFYYYFPTCTAHRLTVQPTRHKIYEKENHRSIQTDSNIHDKSLSWN